jgi:hypothetical protein
MYLLSTVLPPSSCQFSERLKASWNSVPHNTVNILIPHAQYLAMMNTLKNTMMTIRNPPHTSNIRDMKNMKWTTILYIGMMNFTPIISTMKE